MVAHAPALPGRGIRRLALAGLFATVLAANATLLGPYLGRAAHVLSRPDPRWLALAVAAELVSMSAAARLQRRMLRAGGVRVGICPMIALTYAANAVSVTLPAGTALGTGYTFRRLRTWGASVPLASFVLTASGVLSVLAFAVIGVLAALLAGTGALASLLSVAGLTTVIVASVGAARLSVVRAAASRLADRAVGRGARWAKRDPEIVRARLRQLVADVGRVRPRRRDWAAGFGFASLNWIGDLACLLAASHAVAGGAADAAGIALVAASYVAGMTVSSVSLSPGGLGLVDGAMILALTHGGVHVGTATAAVVLYRVISFVFVLGLGWAIWANRWRADRHRRPSRSASISRRSRTTRTRAGSSMR